MVEEEIQTKLFQEVTSIETAREKKRGQQKLIETKPVYIPYNQVEELLNVVNVAYLKTQDRLEEQGKDLKESVVQSRRLANSVELMISQAPIIGIDQKVPMVKWGLLKEGEIADIAIADGSKIPSEQAYPLMSWQIVDMIGQNKLTPSFLGTILKGLLLKDDSTYHYDFQSGRSGKTPRYKHCIIPALYERLKNYERYEIPQAHALKWQSYLKPESEVIQ
jgi:hypothetical protein